MAQNPGLDTYIPMCRCTGKRFSGKYNYGRTATGQYLHFFTDGTFIDRGVLDQMLVPNPYFSNPRTQRGTYSIQSQTMIFTFADGRRGMRTFYAPKAQENGQIFTFIGLGWHVLAANQRTDRRAHGRRFRFIIDRQVEASAATPVTLCMPDSLEPGIYIQALSTLPHPIPCASTGTGELIRLAASHHLPPAHGITQLRFFPAQGNQIWQSHASSQDPEWKYVNVRRLLIFIEHSLTQQLQWAVFETNGPELWARLTSSVGSFLTSLWQSGALHGKKRHEALLVRCTAMTQEDIDSGRFVIVVGFAPICPAEFVILQITGQTTKKKNRHEVFRTAIKA